MENNENNNNENQITEENRKFDPVKDAKKKFIIFIAFIIIMVIAKFLIGE